MFIANILLKQPEQACPEMPYPSGKILSVSNNLPGLTLCVKVAQVHEGVSQVHV